MKRNRIKLMLRRAVSYRIPLQVTSIRRYCVDGCFAECPRCDNAIERDYMRYCTCCGQRLGWRWIDYAVIEDVPVGGREQVENEGEKLTSTLTSNTVLTSV